MKGFIRFFFVLTLLFSVSGLKAQWRLIMEIKVTEEGKSLPGAEIKLYKNGSFVETVLTNSKGEADVALNPNGDYSIEIGGNNGLIKKKLSVNTNNVPAGIGKGDQAFPAEVDIFKKIDGLDYSILDDPIGKIIFDEDFGGFDVDLAYTKRQKTALDKLQKEFLAQKEKEAEAEKAKLKEYAAVIKVADKAFADEDWEKAEQEYKKAEALNPLETYPSFQLAELKSKLIELRETNKKYDAAIAKADGAASSGDLELAISEYNKASSLKPNEEYPKTKAKEIQAQLANQAKAEQGYLAAIEKGDNALSSNDLEAAKLAFEEASSLKPTESYPKNKIAEIDDILSKNKAKEEEYKIAIQLADGALSSKDYNTAKSQYEKALGIKPTESYPKDQIAKVEGLLAESAKKEQEYLATIERGDQALAANKYEEAKSAFEEAIKIKPDEEYPKGKIKEINQFIAENDAKNKAYKSAIAEADKLLNDESYEEAKAKYAEASKVKPTESYPREQIKGIDARLADLAAEQEEIRLQKEKEAKIKAEFDSHMTAAQNALEKSIYELAKEEYEKALAIIPEEEYAVSQLKKVEDIIAKQLAQKLAREKLNADYNAAINSADAAFDSQDYPNSQKFYNDALALKPDESYPQDRLKEIEGLIAEIAKKEEDYLAAIKNGDAAFKNKNWDEAKTAYNDALAIKSDEYPKTQIQKIEEELKAIAAQEEAAAKLEADYQAAIAEGDQKLGSKKYDDALDAFEKALSLKPSEQYPTDKIAEIKAEQERIADEKAEEERLAALQKEYEALISKADSEFKSENLKEARKSYQDALALKSEESYPQTKIDEINGILADAAEQDKAYNDAIASADQLFNGEKYEDAKAKYAEASSIKSSESYPKDQIKAIEEKLAELAAKQEEIRLQNEKAAALDAKYQALVTEADGMLQNKDYENAKAKYNEALSVKDEQYPKDKIAEIEAAISALADKEAAEKAAAEKAKIEAKYLAIIAEADAILEKKDYENAKAKYNEALTVKSDEYPKNKIAEIDAIISAMADKKAAEKAAAEQAKLEAKYQAIIVDADALYDSKKLTEAKDKYSEALGIKEDAYPAQQIEKIDNELALIAGAEAAAAKKEADYLAAISKGDKALSSDKLDEALQAYVLAKDIKPNEPYPKDKITEINDLKAKKSAEQEGLKLAIDRQYVDAIDEADALFENGKLEEAKGKYFRASELKPSESYPKDQIKKIDKILLDQLAKEEEIRLQNEREAKNEASYQSAIAAGDKYYTEKKWNEAENEYRLALSLKPSESYPQEQLNKIKEQLAQEAAKQQKNAELAEKNAQYDALIQSADDAFEKKSYNLAKTDYEKALAIKPSDSYAQSKLDEIKEILARQKELLAKKEEEKPKVTDEPITIKKGPKATISGNAEAEIERLYKEMWAKKNVEKNQMLKEKEELVKKLQDEEREKEAQKRANAIEKIEAISISMNEQNAMAEDFYMQNYETVKQKTDDVTEGTLELKRNSERERNSSYQDDVSDLELSLRELKQERETDMLEGKNEMVANENEELRKTTQRLEKEQKEHREKVREEFVMLEEEVLEYHQGLASANLNRSISELGIKEKELSDTYREYNKGGQQRIEEYQQIVNDKNVELRQFSMSKNESFKENQLAIEEKERVLREETKELNAESEKRRQANNSEEYYLGEDRPRQDQEASEYSQGVTEEIVENDDGSTTIRRIVVEGTEVDIYEKTYFAYGAVYYFKNGNNITQDIWDSESR